MYRCEMRMCKYEGEDEFKYQGHVKTYNTMDGNYSVNKDTSFQAQHRSDVAHFRILKKYRNSNCELLDSVRKYIFGHLITFTSRNNIDYYRREIFD